MKSATPSAPPASPSAGGVQMFSERLTGKDNLALQAREGWVGDRLVRWESEQGAVTEWLTRWASDGSFGSQSFSKNLTGTRNWLFVKVMTDMGIIGIASAPAGRA